MPHSHGSHDGWSSLSSVESLTDLSVPTPPPSKGSGTGGPGFRRLNARMAADFARPTSPTAAMAEPGHRIPSDAELKSDRFKYAPSDREVWRPAMEQLSQKISEQQHELWELQAKLRAEAHRSDELVRTLKVERKEHKEVVTALTSELSARRAAEAAAQSEASRRNAAELERAWKRCAELEQQRRAAEDDASARKQEAAVLEAKVTEMQTQIAGLKLMVQTPPAAAARVASDEQGEAAVAQLKHENGDLQAENTRLKAEIETLRTAFNASSSQKEAVDTLKQECEALRASNSALKDTSESLKATLQREAQQTSSKIKQAEDAAWQQASHLAADQIAEAARRTEIEISRLHEKTESQAAIIASQKEFVCMANSQLDYMRGLLGESLGKLLDQRQPSIHAARHLQPSPFHASPFRPSPPPESSAHSSPAPKSWSSGYKPSAQPATSAARPQTPKHESKHESALPRRPSAPAERAAHAQVHTPPPPSASISSSEASSADSLSTIEPDSDPRDWVAKTPAPTYPLQQSTVNHSTSSASSTSTPSGRERERERTAAAHDEPRPSVSFLDALYERLASGRMTREELEDFENVYDARGDIMAERPKLELDARNMLSALRPHAARKHAPIMSRMAEDMA